MSGYETAIFFDNDKTYVENVQMFCDICGVHVGETPGFDYKLLTPLPEVYKTDFGEIGENKNPYYDFVGKMEQGKEAYDKLSGFKEEHEPLLDQWIESTQGKRRVAIFDWDRTITKIEGFWFPIGNYTVARFGSAFNKRGVTSSHINQYLCGGIERYNFIKGIMQKCKNNGVNILILTNSGMCTTSPAFKELVADICGDAPHAIVCSRVPPWNGHKGLALRATNPALCTKSVGGKSRKTNRTKRTRRKTQTRRS